LHGTHHLSYTTVSILLFATIASATVIVLATTFLTTVSAFHKARVTGAVIKRAVAIAVGDTTGIGRTNVGVAAGRTLVLLLDKVPVTGAIVESVVTLSVRESVRVGRADKVIAAALVIDDPTRRWTTVNEANVSADSNMT
jgi:hypothetical protein